MTTAKTPFVYCESCGLRVVTNTRIDGSPAFPPCSCGGTSFRWPTPQEYVASFSSAVILTAWMERRCNADLLSHDMREDALREGFPYEVACVAAFNDAVRSAVQSAV